MTDKKEDIESLSLTSEEILEDYRLAYMSRQVSLVGRREVMSGKAKFGIFGGGKELPQVALAHFIQNGDFRSGYYRDQTLMFASDETSVQEFFAQLYAHADVEAEPATAGRSMNAHFATRSLDEQGQWRDLTRRFNSSADVSPTGSQMPRLVGLAYASRLYRELDELQANDRSASNGKVNNQGKFSNNGNEVAFGMVGNATCAEGMFWEAINAIGVLKAPAVISIWDDGYGISVTNKYQMVKRDMSELLAGFQRQEGTGDGYDIYKVRGWNYPELLQTYQKAVSTTRKEHVPAIVHVVELTQPQGHSTSGSHERYKSKQRLAWEEEYDGIRQFRLWILEQGLASEQELDEMESGTRDQVEEIRIAAWKAFSQPIQQERRQVLVMLDKMSEQSSQSEVLASVREKLTTNPKPLRREIMAAVQEALLAVKDEDFPARTELMQWRREQEPLNTARYDSGLYSGAALEVPVVEPVYSPQSPQVYAFEVLNACFDAALARDPRVIAFGEDVGRLGDVNQGFRGLQAKYGELRVSDTGIRETTIIGQAIGMAMRGLRPIAEIQYLDYLLYALQIMADDLATVHWRTRGGQIAPVIVRTRGHRLEGIWHSGSLMAGILNLVRGMRVLVPRNMTQAAGFYNTLLRSNEPALVVEVLNAYRNKERLPDNIGEFTLPLGVPEILRPGEDVTVVTYGAMCSIVLEAAELMSQVGIEAEVIDVQTLLPFDLQGVILESLKKTSRILFTDEDVPGGTTAYMLQNVIEKQGGYYWLDSEPRTLPGKEHRPAYGSDGDYWSKPNRETVFSSIYDLMHEVDPARFPNFL
jgi:pyruvate/2-oxoglutarate/acetoin dehydrogenase E1 component/TPP-dependent pyruvate/acetoin dehydrogenase alpha subunit